MKAIMCCRFGAEIDNWLVGLVDIDLVNFEWRNLMQSMGSTLSRFPRPNKNTFPKKHALTPSPSVHSISQSASDFCLYHLRHSVNAKNLGNTRPRDSTEMYIQKPNAWGSFIRLFITLRLPRKETVFELADTYKKIKAGPPVTPLSERKISKFVLFK